MSPTEPHAVTMAPKKVQFPSQGTLVGWAKKRQTIAQTVVAETITKTDNVPKSADETDDIGDVVGNVDNQSIAVSVNKTQPVFVKSFQTVVA